MVGILSSLKATRASKASEPISLRIPILPVRALEFLAPPRRPRSNADLARMIESEIIPRLMMAHGAPDAPAAPRSSVGPRTLEAFTRMALSTEVETLTAYVDALIQGGLSLQDVYVDLLIPTARRLGDDWNEDVISFTDVTIGLSRLQQVVRALGQSLPSHDADGDAPSACFVPAPGEQHTFGLVILEDYFRRGGWRTWLDTMATREDAARTVATDWFDVFGLSATSDAPVEVIASTIAEVRRASRNPGLFIMVGGRLFIEDPTLADRVGADAATATAGDALHIADKAIRRVAAA